MPAAPANDVSVDSVVEALVREHLTNREFTSTLTAWQQEQPTVQHPINKRSILHDVLGLTAAQSAPQSRHKPSTLDVLVQQHLLRKQHAPDAPTSSSKTQPHAAGGLTFQNQALATKQQPPTVSECSTQQQQEQTWHRRLPAMTQQQNVPAQTPHQPPGSSRPLGSRMQPPRSSRASTASTAAYDSASATQQLEELVVCDVDFDDSDTAAVASTSTTAARSTGRVLQDFQPLPPEQQRQLAQLVWGEPGVQPEAAWQQGLIWNDAPGLEWGLLQLSGGPCGVLAAVQAHLIATLMEQHLWRPTNPAAPPANGSSSSGGAGASGAGAGARPTAEQLQAALTSSLVLMLWTCATTSSNSSSSGGRRSGPAAHVVVLQQSAAGSAGVRGLCDVGQVLLMVQVATANSMAELEVLVRAALPQWCARKGWGLLLLVYSALLSRGCHCAASDMDNEVRLVDTLGYCSMELVNLLLTGAAVSNVFDGCQTFADAAAGPEAGAGGGGADSGEQLVIKGVQQRGRVGLLTLFEWYRYVEVGQHLKCPRLPVWVVCSESHFSVLALSSHNVAGAQLGQLEQQPSTGQPLLLQYYDGLSKQEGPIVLELRPARTGCGWSSRMEGVAEERGVWQGRPIPALECVLETKWRDLAVTWHGSEPIL